ncbi:hypothetical protein [Streptomyces sp. NPDC093225]|uniref:hypothetical protein n=1 Tax=Streptomyces sp. NPDC093225 TaxID=3366034 RepID=UPI00382F5A5C
MKEFKVEIEEAFLKPDENAIREFVKQFNTEVENDPALGNRFAKDPGAVLAERGLAADLQRELLAASGVPGADEMACHISCFRSELSTLVHDIALPWPPGK